MKNEQAVIKEIISLETFVFDEESYLDESQQSRIQTLYEILGRNLTDDEKNIVYEKRLHFMDECIGEKSEDYLNKKMYYEI